MDLFEFEQAVINGEITDFRPYVEGGTFHENRDRKALCIRYGVAQELYPEWAQSDDPDKYDDWIQLLLAENGYCLDILSESEAEDILAEVLKHDLNYALDEDGGMMNYRHLVYDALMDAKDIPFNVIETYFKTINEYVPEDNTELELKYKAMQVTPTVIEKTMTPMQLFTAQNPLWALNLTGKQIKLVINSAEEFSNCENFKRKELRWIYSNLRKPLKTATSLISSHICGSKNLTCIAAS